MREPPGNHSIRAVTACFRAPRLSVTGLSVVPFASILGGKPHYVHFGWFVISVANLVVIALMIVVFVLAIALPFPHGREKR